MIKYGTTNPQVIEERMKEDEKNAEDKIPSQTVNVRMVTGDNMATAMEVARKVGIISQDEYDKHWENVRVPKTHPDLGIAMTGDEFRARISPYEEKYDPVN